MCLKEALTEFGLCYGGLREGLRKQWFVWIKNSVSQSVQSPSRVRLFATPCTERHQASCWSPAPRVYSTSCPLSQWCQPTISSSVVPLSSHLQSSQHQGLSQWVSSLHQVAKGLEFQLQHQPFSLSNEYSGLISFRMDWLDLLAVQELPRVFSNTTVQKHQFFGAQPSL